jgi:hypothetical protein
MALRVATGSRTQAVSASLAGSPAARRRRWKPAIAGSLPRAAATAATWRHARSAARPPRMARLPRIVPPLSRLNGATPTRAAAWRRAGQPLPGPPDRALPHRCPVEVPPDLGQRFLEPAEVGVDPPCGAGSAGRVAPVALVGHQHLGQPASSRHQGAEVPGRLAGQGRTGGRTGGRTASRSGRSPRRRGGRSRPAGPWRPSMPPAASSTTSAAAPSSSWPRVELPPVGRGWTSSRRSATSMPTQARALPMTRPSPDAGLSALATVRVARTRPAGPTFLRGLGGPTHGTAGSRRPTRSRYQIGSPRHAKLGRVAPQPVEDASTSSFARRRSGVNSISCAVSRPSAMSSAASSAWLSARAGGRAIVVLTAMRAGYRLSPLSSSAGGLKVCLHDSRPGRLRRVQARAG